MPSLPPVAAVRRRALAWAAATWLGALGVAQEPAAPRAEGQAPHGRRRALLVACTEYPALKSQVPADVYETRLKLVGPANDAAMWKDVLTTTLGFAAGDVTELVGWPDDAARRPTLANITAALRALAEASRPGDAAFVFFAGHGARQPDADGDETDGFDEVFLPADAARVAAKGGPIPNALVDDALRDLLLAIRAKGAFVWSVFDCCHSGTLVRAADADVVDRYVPDDVLGVDRDAAAGGAARPAPAATTAATSDAGFVAMYAAEPHRKAPEMSLPRGGADAARRGLFSYSLGRALKRTGGRASFAALQAQVIADYRALPYEDVTPFAEGEVALGAAAALGAPGGPATAGFAQASCDREGRWVLDVGTLGEVVPDCVVAVYDPARPDGDPLATTSVIEASPTQALLRIPDEAAARLDKTLVHPARVLSAPLGDVRLRIAAAREDGTRIVAAPDLISAELKAAFAAAERRFEVVADPAAADWVFLKADAGWLLAPTLAAGDDRRYAAATTSALVDAFGRVAKARNLRRFAAKNLPPLARGLDVAVVRIPPDGKPERLGTGAPLRPGDRLRVDARNATGGPVDLHVFYLDADQGVVALFPDAREGATPRLGAGDKLAKTLLDTTINDRPTGSEEIVVLALPRKESEDPINLSWLGQGGLRPVVRGDGAGDARLQDLLSALADGSVTRGAPTLDSGGVPQALLTAWRTDWAPFRLPDAYPGPAVEVAAFPAARSEGPPDPWLGATRACRGRTRPLGGAADLLLLGGATPTVAFVDVDDSDKDRLATDAELRDAVTARSFDAEAAFASGPEGRTAWYDADDDGAFDLVLRDVDGDGAADVRWRSEGGRWVKDAGGRAPWFSTRHLSRYVVSASARRRGEGRALVHDVVLKMRALTSEASARDAGR